MAPANRQPDAHPGDAGTAGYTGYTGIVLCGGRASRMGGIDKTAAVLGGRTLLDTAVAALHSAAQIIAVGDPRPTIGPVRWVREHPAGAGPAAAIAAALPLVEHPLTVIMAADLPFAVDLPPALIAILAQHPDAHAAIPIDQAGNRQPLAAAYRTAALRHAAANHPVLTNQPVRTLTGDLRVVTVPAHHLPRHCLLDVDTPTDLRRAADLADTDPGTNHRHDGNGNHRTSDPAGAPPAGTTANPSAEANPRNIPEPA